jgi:hypothetical protein
MVWQTITDGMRRIKTQGNIERERNACQNENAAQVERIPGDGEDTCGNDLARGKARVGRLAIARKLPAGKDCKTNAQDNQNSTCKYAGWSKGSRLGTG